MKLTIIERTVAALLLASCGSSAQVHSRVQVHVMDLLGDKVSTQAITISGAGSTIEVEQDKTFALTYGSYTVKVTAPAFAPATLSVVINQPAQILTVGLKLGRYEDADPLSCSIVGTVPAAVMAVRIRAVQLFGSYTTDVPVDDQKRFELRNLDCGDYLLIAMERSKFLGTMVVRSAALPKHFEMKFTSDHELL